MRLRWIVILSVPASAWAEEPGAPKPAETATSTQTLPIEQAKPLLPNFVSRDEAWASYDAAFDALASGDRALAIATLREVGALFPGHPAATRAADLLARMSGMRAPALVRPPAPSLHLGESLRNEEYSDLARAELISFQTSAGILAGAEICVLAQCDDTRAVIALLLLGAGAGVTVSTLATSDGITPGHATAIDTGTLWGAWNGLASAVVLDVDDEQQGVGLILLGQLVGTAVGHVAFEVLEPSAGDVSLSTSVGMWAGVMVAFAHGIAEFDADPQLLMGTLLLASDVGLIGGAFLSELLPMSRGRALLIDASGLLGTLTGVGVDLLIQGEDAEPQPLFALGLAGMVAGLGLGAYLSREWDLEEAPDVQLSALPLRDGAGFGLSGAW